MQKEKLMHETLGILHKLYPDEGTALGFGSVFQLAVAVILSAQCTDARVNMVTKKLFAELKTPEDFADVPRKDLEKMIYSTGFYRAKAKNISGMAKAVLAGHGGKMPRTMEELVHLPGIGRKTANIILSEGYGIVEGIAVDTHVKRLSTRLGFTKSPNPEIIERDLAGLAPKSEWHFLSNGLIWHGRRVCFARKPDCTGCALNKLCPSAFKTGLNAKNSQ